MFLILLCAVSYAHSGLLRNNLTSESKTESKNENAVEAKSQSENEVTNEITAEAKSESSMESESKNEMKSENEASSLATMENKNENTSESEANMERFRRFRRRRRRGIRRGNRSRGNSRGIRRGRFSRFRRAARRVARRVKRSARRVKKAVKKVSKRAKKAAKKAAKGVRKGVRKAGRAAKRAAKRVAKGVRKGVRKAGRAAKRVARGAAKGVKGAVKRVGRAAKRVARGAAKGVRKGVRKAGRAAKRVARGAAKGVKGAVKRVGKGARKGAKIISKSMRKAARIAKNGGKRLANKLPRRHRGKKLTGRKPPTRPSRKGPKNPPKRATGLKKPPKRATGLKKPPTRARGLKKPPKRARGLRKPKMKKPMLLGKSRSSLPPRKRAIRKKLTGRRKRRSAPFKLRRFGKLSARRRAMLKKMKAKLVKKHGARVAMNKYGSIRVQSTGKCLTFEKNKLVFKRCFDYRSQMFKFVGKHRNSVRIVPLLNRRVSLRVHGKGIMSMGSGRAMHFSLKKSRVYPHYFLMSKHGKCVGSPLTHPRMMHCHEVLFQRFKFTPKGLSAEARGGNNFDFEYNRKIKVHGYYQIRTINNRCVKEDAKGHPVIISGCNLANDKFFFKFTKLSGKGAHAFEITAKDGHVRRNSKQVIVGSKGEKEFKAVRTEGSYVLRSLKDNTKCLDLGSSTIKVAKCDTHSHTQLFSLIPHKKIESSKKK